MAGKRKPAFDSTRQPLAKKAALQRPLLGERKRAFDSAGQPPAKKPALEEPGKKPGSDDGSRQPANPTRFRFHCVDVQWQRNACATLGLRFEKPNGVSRGGPDVVLNPPSAKPSVATETVCFTHSHTLFVVPRTSTWQCLEILNHMASERVAPLLLCGHLHGYASIAEYKTATKMDRDGFWGTEVEMLACPCTSDIVLTTLMWSALFETPSDLTLSGLLPICLVCGTSHMHACRLTHSGHTLCEC